MVFKAAAIALLVPPTALLFLALVGLLVRSRIGRLLRWFGVVSLLALAIPAVGGSLLVTLEQDLPLTPPKDAPPQAIIILGGDVRRARDASDDLPGPFSLERLRAAAELYRRTRLPILVSGGAVHAGEPSIAALMAESLQRDFQVPVQWVEARSLDTWQNAQSSAAILQQQGITSVYVVTQAWHMRRALIAFAATGLVATAAPTRLDAAPTAFATDYLPDGGGWQSSYIAFHEWIGCAWYALR